MSQRREKRARQKARRDERRRALMDAMRRQRRRRNFTLMLVTGTLIVGGAAIVFFLGGDTTPEEQADPLDPLTVTAPMPQPVACGAELPEAAGGQRQLYSEPEDQGLTADTSPVLRLETSCGTIDIALDVDASPELTNSIAYLANEGFYDGLTFHRNLPGFVVQGGDPRGDGTGGAGYEVIQQPPPDTSYVRGVVAMAKAEPDPSGTSGSQFFIVAGEDSGLPPEFAVLGEVVSGMDVVDTILQEAPGDPPATWVYIESATIIEG